MALNERAVGDETPPAYAHPISRSLGFLVLVALVILWALRHLFGSIRAEVGVK